MIQEGSTGAGGLDEPLNIHVCITKIMKPLMIVVPILVMFSIVLIKVIEQKIFICHTLLSRRNYQHIMMISKKILQNYQSQKIMSLIFFYDWKYFI